MIGSVLMCKLHALRRDRIASLLVFVLPIAFFSIFAGIMGNVSGGKITSMRVLVVDLSQTDSSRDLIKALKGAGGGIQISTSHSDPPVAWTEESARTQVQNGKVPAAIIVPKGLGLNMFGSGDAVPVDLLVDPSNPVASTMIPGLLQKAAMDGMRGQMIKGGVATFEKFAGPLSARQKAAMSGMDKMLESQAQAKENAKKKEEDKEKGKAKSEKEQADELAGMILPVKLENVRQDTAGETRSMVAYYFAGIGVMFLLFSTAGAAGSLLEDEEAGVLDRMLCTPLGMSRLLTANWLWITIMGLASMIVLLLFATFVFGLGPWTWPRIVAALIMTIFTASAASSLGMLLASICRSRAQLAGISTVVILVMSALGGSMMPRFIMPAFVQEMGKATFNSWAMQGYLEVFWYSPIDVSLPALLKSMLLPLVVLLGMTAIFMCLSRLFVRRWETN